MEPGDPSGCRRATVSEVRAADAREHKEITADLLRKPYYFSRWYYCTYLECRTEWAMPEEFQVGNRPV